ncbi:hypothetical protein [Macrococcus lamae]|uniref:Asparagine synthetase domain-containing protein n=1 Tax=Macrococcus lamae TaxID=198484 RepID=A0A4V3BF53_9STAP|nr:hypothetical protein [Macrococcus lamae]TDM12395.1 hypothetical protein ERX29_03465 [Macrococcus lamae]
MLFNNQEYFKGFLITNKYLHDIDGINLVIGSMHVKLDNDLAHFEFIGERHLILLGYAMDTHRPDDSELDILKALSRSDDHQFVTLLNRMNGRYILLCTDGDEVKIYPDATTMRPLFYHREACVLASHAKLVADVTMSYFNQNVSEHQKVKGYLDMTRFADIYKLNCNHYFDMTAHQTVRFYPSDSYSERTLSEVLEQTLRLFDNQKQWLQYKDKYMTLTAGIDSRVSMALLHDRTLPYLTYISTNSQMTDFAKHAYKFDELIVKEMVEDLALNHTFFSIHSKGAPTSYEHALYNQCESLHNADLSYQLAHSEFKGKLHIKSSLFGMAKLPMAESFYSSNEQQMIESLILKKQPEGTKYLEPEQLLQSFLERAQYNTKGFYLTDLYFQETRLANWHSNNTQETDNSVEVFILVNTREFMNLFASMPLAVRNSGQLHREWINHLWPVLNFYSVNGDFTLFESFKSFKENSSKQHLSITGSNISIQNNKIIPNFPMNQTRYTFNVANNSDERMTVLVQTAYNNPSGRGSIHLVTATKIIDYLDLNSGVTIILNPGDNFEAHIQYKKLNESLSWQRAGELTIKQTT